MQGPRSGAGRFGARRGGAGRMDVRGGAGRIGARRGGAGLALTAAAVSALLAATGCQNGAARSAGAARPTATDPADTAARAVTDTTAGTSTRPSGTARTTGTADAAGTFTIAATGDLLSHQKVVAAAKAAAGGRGYDYRPLLAPLRPLLQDADLAVCHLETPLARPGQPISYYPIFAAPRQLAPALKWLGYDSCTTASNHTLDKGLAGVRFTLDALDAAGVAHVGAARTAAEQRPRRYLVRGVPVAHLDYTYGLNGIPKPRSAPWVVQLIDVPKILADARAARRAGARFVVVGLHWGQEYSSPATAEQRRIAKALLASPDVDLLIGCHAHVVQPIERISSGGVAKFAVYGMGNLLAQQGTSAAKLPTHDGLLVSATVSRRGGRYVVSAMRYTPTYVDPQTSRVYPVADRLRVPGLPAAARADLEASWRRTVERVNLLGAARAGVRPAALPPS